jgi:hypothetical protein
MSGYKLRLYRNHDRQLLFDGRSDDTAIVMLPATKEIVLYGRTYKVVNNVTFPGELNLWLSA